MSNLPFDLTDIDANEVQALENTFNMLRAGFKVSVSHDPGFDIRQFDFFKDQKNISIGGTLLIGHPESGCYLHFIRGAVQAHHDSGAENNYKYQVWASATLRNDFGKMAIRRETLVDKLSDPVHSAELYFKDDPSFSKKISVVAADKQKATRSMTKAFRNVVLGIGQAGWEIEIVNSALIIGDNRSIDPKRIVSLATIASKLSRVK
jgi:hypothetical protein